jgi:hypothetical protein
MLQNVKNYEGRFVRTDEYVKYSQHMNAGINTNDYTGNMSVYWTCASCNAV